MPVSRKLWRGCALLGALMLAPPAWSHAPPGANDTSSARSGLARASQSGRPAQRLAQAAQGLPDSSAAASAAAAASSEPIGNVAAVTGIATVIRNKNSLPLHERDDIFLNDEVQTSSSSSLSITFNDATTFKLSANAKITIDKYVYEDGGKQNTGLFDIGKGTIAFVAAAVAKTGDMKIATPTSTLGIRGTTGVVEVSQNSTGSGNGVGDNIKLYPDPDGHVGRIEVNDRAGQRLGALSQGASGLTVRPGIGGARATAQPLLISPQQAARDRGLVREVHAAQSIGRQVVTEQRAARRLNPPGSNRSGQPPSQQKPQLPSTAPTRQGQPPGSPGSPGNPNGKGNVKPPITPAPQQQKRSEKSREIKPGAESSSRRGDVPQAPAVRSPPATGPSTAERPAAPRPPVARKPPKKKR